MFKKMRATIERYRVEAAGLDPQAFSWIHAMTGSNAASKRVRRVSRSDPELAVALFLLDYERETGTTAADFNDMVDRLRAQAREEGVPEDELEDFLAFHFRVQLAEQGINIS